MKKYIYIIALSVFFLSLTINGSALTQFTADFVGEGTFPIHEPTNLILVGMGLFGLAGVSRSNSKK